MPLTSDGVFDRPIPRWATQLDEPKRYKGAWGGRGSGKSHELAVRIVEEMVARPDCSVVCIREIQKSLELSAKKLIEAKIIEHGVGHLFEIQKSVIKRIGGTGICIFQGMQDHTADSIKSLEGFDIAWVEEAQSLSENSLRLLRPTIRAEGSQIWFSWNPRRRADAVEKLLRPRTGPRSDAVVVRANYVDNPWLPSTLVAEAADDKAADYDNYKHVWLGGYDDGGAKTVIPAKWVEAAIGLDIPVEGKLFSATDVAGGGEDGDTNAQAGRKGPQLFHLDVWNGTDTSLTTKRAVDWADGAGVKTNFYDSAGLGEGVTGAWADIKRRKENPAGLQMLPWNGGSAVLKPNEPSKPWVPNSPLNKDQYLNLKAQAWFGLRRRFENAWLCSMGRDYDPENIITIDPSLPHLEELQDELSQPVYDETKSGKTVVDKQPDGSASPNLADSVVMAFWPVESGYDWSNF